MLNGQIEVNGWPIGSWRAVRTDTAAQEDLVEVVAKLDTILCVKG